MFAVLSMLPDMHSPFWAILREIHPFLCFSFAKKVTMENQLLNCAQGAICHHFSFLAVVRLKSAMLLALIMVI